MGTRDDAATLLRRRLREHSLSQADIGRLFGKSRAWASQELFADPQKVLRRILVDDPTRLDALAQALGWEDRDELLRDLDVFGVATLPPRRDEVSLPAAPAPTPVALEIPEGLLEAGERYAAIDPLIAHPKVQAMLARQGNFGGRGPVTAPEWWRYFESVRQYIEVEE